MKIVNIGDAHVIISNPDTVFGYFGWPTAKRLQNGRIAVAASGFRVTHVCPFGKAIIAFSEDEGETYSPPAVVIDTTLDDRDGGLCPFDETGLIYTSFTNRHNFTDGIVDPIRNFFYAYLDALTDADNERYLGATFKISHDCGKTFGQLMHSPVTSPHGPIQLSDGRILWVGMRFEEKTGNIDYSVDAYVMDKDGGMEKIGEVPPVYVDGVKLKSCEPYTHQLDDGKLVCLIRVEPEFTLFQSVSCDLGKTWSVPSRVLPLHGGAPAYILRHSSGVLIATYGYRNMHDDNSPYGIKVLLSYDNAESWEDAGYIYSNKVSYDLGYPTSVELSDGSIATVFYATHTAGKPAVIMQQKWRLEP